MSAQTQKRNIIDLYEGEQPPEDGSTGIEAWIERYYKKAVENAKDSLIEERRSRSRIKSGVRYLRSPRGRVILQKMEEARVAAGAATPDEYISMLKRDIAEYEARIRSAPLVDSESGRISP